MEIGKQKTPGRTLLLVSCIIMLVLSLPMTLWTYGMARSASPYDVPGDGLATWGCIIGALTYILSAPAGITGLIVNKRPQRYGICRVLGWILIALLAVCIVMQRVYYLLTMLPLMVVTILYLVAAYKAKKIDRD